MTITYINYADHHFRKAQNSSAFAAKTFGKADKVIKYGPNDIDEDFREKYKHILKEKRGGGYWLWKPYLILKTLESIEEGDILVYCDSGAFFINELKNISEELERLEQPILGFKIPLIEKQWNKRNAIESIGVSDFDSLNSSQVCATYMIIKKCKESMRFIEEYLYFSCNELIITDMPNEEDLLNDENFIEHRHDQSIFSLLFKKYRYKPLSDISDFGFFPEKIVQDDRFLYDFDFKISKYAGSIMLFRNGNPILHFIKFHLKRLLKSIFPTLYMKLLNKRKVTFLKE